MGDMRTEIDKWCERNKVKGGERNARLSNSERSGGHSGRTSDISKPVLQTK